MCAHTCVRIDLVRTFLSTLETCCKCMYVCMHVCMALATSFCTEYLLSACVCLCALLRNTDTHTHTHTHTAYVHAHTTRNVCPALFSHYHMSTNYRMHALTYLHSCTERRLISVSLTFLTRRHTYVHTWAQTYIHMEATHGSVSHTSFPHTIRPVIICTHTQWQWHVRIARLNICMYVCMYVCIKSGHMSGKYLWNKQKDNIAGQKGIYVCTYMYVYNIYGHAYVRYLLLCECVYVQIVYMCVRMFIYTHIVHIHFRRFWCTPQHTVCVQI
jgi:hypothetical protein